RGQPYRHSRPQTGGAFYAHGSAMQLYQTLDQRQAEPGSLELPRIVVLHLPEWLAQPRQIVQRDADAGVVDEYPDGIVPPDRAKTDAAAFRRELDRVRHQIDENLLHGPLIADDL